MADTQVLIVGAGPVGLTLAVDLGLRGVRCTLIEQKEAPQFLPKMERCNARTMEIYRRMGIAKRIRAAGLDRHVPMDVYIVLAMNERPLLRLPYPSVAEAEDEIRTTNDGTLPLEPYQLISQYTLEPLLKSIAESLPAVTVRYGCEFVSLNAGSERRHRHRARRPTARPTRYRRSTSSAATAARVRCASSSTSPCAAKAICWRCARPCSVATSCSTRSRSVPDRAAGGTITSPTTARHS